MILSFDFSTWWESLKFVEQVYWIITIPATLLFIIQLILTFIGGDFDDHSDMDVDAEIDADHGMGFHFITVKNLISFMAIFGWSGLACLDSGLGIGITVFISVISGLIMMVIMASLYYFMGKLTDSGTLEMKNAIGAVGDVYLTIPGKKAGMGKVQVKIQGALRTLDALTDELENIKTGSIVEVIDVINDNILLVRRSR